MYDACHAMPWCQEGDSKDIINTRAKMIIPMICNLMPLHSRRVLSTARIELAKNPTSRDGNTLATRKPTFNRRIIQQDIYKKMQSSLLLIHYYGSVQYISC